MALRHQAKACVLWLLLCSALGRTGLGTLSPATEAGSLVRGQLQYDGQLCCYLASSISSLLTVPVSFLTLRPCGPGRANPSPLPFRSGPVTSAGQPQPMRPNSETGW
jgi:hypothetical protein